ncbi:cysteine proteinase [Macrolepiota fuliginosa MF-IS2]|uniref:Cysteine proteinase n=1 Tax=Macrolepiota fuliginosa MF-IS2 TaxID=1400762 RepID=A0A9P5XQQ1_9AGAR|nr:cysteine proteinase [Macrolepiota fuliginosa MF-IS2]
MTSQNDGKSAPVRMEVARFPPESRPPIIPDHKALWPSGPGKPIPVPSGHGAVLNPYTQIGNTTQRTNLTARQTLISRSIAPRKTVRNPGPNSISPSGPLSRNKGKGKAFELRRPQRSSPREVIDVDADHVSTDDLDVIELENKSSYFQDLAKTASSSRTSEKEQPVAGPSLIGDGENTRRLQAKYDTTEEPRRGSSSPIETFPEDDVEKNHVVKSSKPASKVLQAVARIEAKEQEGRESSMPIVNFKRKTRMQPKAGGSKSKPQQVGSDRLSELHGLRSSINNTHTKTWSARLPISMLLIGIQRLPEYDTIVFENNGTTVNFETSARSKPIGPIEITQRNFSEFVVSDPYELDTDAPVFLYLKSLEKASFASWVLNYSSVFQPGSGNRGQISVRFDTNNQGWGISTYKACIDKLARSVKRETIRRLGCRTLWNTLSKSAKYSTDNLHDSSDSMKGDSGEQTRAKRGSSEPNRTSESLDADIDIVESSSSKQRVEGFQKYRYTSDDVTRPSIRKRSSDTQEPKDGAAKVSVNEPPPKRQRTEEPKTLRRSSRQQEKAPNYDADEVILVYPPGAPGAINVTTGDLLRLQPEEFLNDTLIEFGLKSWLRELEATNPELASQVHIFNSFFYKKLNKRNIKESYDSVRKWTSKIDIFSKKYIIVPINEHLHWYLALIYEPEHTLQPPPPSLQPHTAVTRRQVRDTQAADNVVGPMAEPTPEPHSTIEEIPSQNNTAEDIQDGTTSETEVERLAFATSCSVTTVTENSSTTSLAPETKELVKTSETPNSELTPGSPMNVDADSEIAAADVVESSSRSIVSDSTMASGANTPIEIHDDSQSTTVPMDVEVAPSRFYGKSYMNNPRRKKIKDSIAEPIIIDERSPDTQPRTKVFIMDSLGNRHPQAMKQLSKWLELEAMDKKKIETVTPAVAKMAPVPVQPNYCDCGLYILHFAVTFMSDPQRYCQIIMTKERPSMTERQADWKDASVSTMRDELRHKILTFSDEWRQIRAAKEEEKKQQQEKAEEEDEDSDVAIVEHIKASGKKGKSNKTIRTKS